MSLTPTLKDRVSQISIGVFVLTIVMMLTTFTLYSMKKTKIAEEMVESALTTNLQNQVNQFIPSFLVPELRQGMDLILERIKSDENLDDARVIHEATEIPEAYSNCVLDNVRITTCGSKDLNYTAVVAPLTESGVHFGYLFKSKANSSPSSLRSVMEMVGLIIFILSLIFFIVYVFVTRLLSTTLPRALDDLVGWIEADLSGHAKNNIKLPFQELEDLKLKITEVMDKYNRSRDQAVIGQLTSGIMHDIRTPLQSIVTAMHLVEEQESISPKRISRLENSHLMCQNNLPIILNIIESTLDGNREIKIIKRNTDLAQTVEKALSMNQDLAKLRHVEVLVDIPQSVISSHDETQFLRVLTNIVKNSIEAASESKILKLVKLSLIETEKSIVINVEDSGPGISGRPDMIFRAFRTSKIRGTGLGLMITKKIVESHGGSITASNSSSLGGAVFEVTLPKVVQGVLA